jgi:RNA polymerase sigma factor (sigma-70 family)
VVLSVSNSTQRSAENNKQRDFDDVWATHFSSVQRCCYRWLNGHQDQIDDAMSVAGEKAFRYYLSAAEQYSLVAPVHNDFSWLCKLTHNVCVDIHRAQARQLAIVNQTESLPDSFYFSENISEPLEQQVERQYTLDALANMISTLPDEMEQVIRYRFVDDMDYQELALRLNINPVNARKKVQLARQKLRAVL